MNIQFAIDHMNDHHKESLKLFAQYIDKNINITDAVLESITAEGMLIKVNGVKNLLFPFTQEDDISDVKNLIISKLQWVKAQMATNSPEMSLEEEIILFKNQFQSIVMGTVEPDGSPHPSYSTYVEDNGYLYIYISEAAQHYHNIKNNGKLEVLFLEDESKATSIFLRKRLRYKSTVDFIEKQSAEYNKILDKLEKTYGNTAKTLRGFNDFHLIKITLLDGSYVKGFGKAYQLVKQDNGSYTTEHMTEGDHTKK